MGREPLSQTPGASELLAQPEGRSCHTHTYHSLKGGVLSLTTTCSESRNLRLKLTTYPPVSFSKLVSYAQDGRSLTVRPRLYANDLTLTYTSQVYCVLEKALTFAAK